MAICTAPVIGSVTCACSATLHSDRGLRGDRACQTQAYAQTLHAPRVERSGMDSALVPSGWSRVVQCGYRVGPADLLKGKLTASSVETTRIARGIAQRSELDRHE